MMLGDNGWFPSHLWNCVLLLLITSSLCINNEFCEKVDGAADRTADCGKEKSFMNTRYVLYDVNPPEGFNLRRDVYVRVATFLHHLNQIDDVYRWILVLPPWGNLYHWRNENIDGTNQIPWAHFFDIPSLSKFTPVIEMHQFIQEYTPEGEKTMLDRVFILQNDLKMFETGNFHDQNEVVPCEMKTNKYIQVSEGHFIGNLWGYRNITVKKVQCLLFHGFASSLAQNFEPSVHRSYMFDHMEIALHDHYGSREFWQARRSMRFNKQLYELARQFRKNQLNSDDDADRTVRPNDWRDEKEQRSAIGGPYLAVHLRRRDFLIGRSDTVPSIANAADQINRKMKELGLKMLFVATDGDEHEFLDLQRKLQDYKVLRYKPSKDVRHKFGDGGIAIIDQIICAHARYFLGTYESTFTFRIQEEREIIGFPAHTTFNNLCGDRKKCPKSSQWEINW